MKLYIYGVLNNHKIITDLQSFFKPNNYYLGKKEKRTSIVGTFAMDLIVALEMSRLQMIKDAQQQKRYLKIYSIN